MEAKKLSVAAGAILPLMFGGSIGAGAGGFAIGEQSASAAGTAIAGAGAVAEDGGAVFYNPAGMTYLRDDQVLLVGQAFAPRNTFSDHGTFDGTGGRIQGTEHIKQEVIPIGALFAVVPVTERLTLGIGITSPFGLASEYEDEWVGHYNTLLSGIATVDINPAVGVRVTDWLSLGAGVSLQYAKGERRSDLDFGTICFTEFFGPAGCAGIGVLPQQADGKLEISVDSWDVGYNLGLLVEPRLGTRVSLAYRSQVHHSFDGDADYSVPAAATPLTFGGTVFQDTDSAAEITFPASLSLSLFHQLTPDLGVMGDVTWTGWHSFETLRIAFANPAQPDIVQEEDWRDTFRYSAGLRYAPSEDWVMRAGIAYDESPVQNALRNPGVPQGDRVLLALGGGYRISERAAVDIAYTYGREADAEVGQFRPESGTVSGEYHNSIHILSAQLSWRF